jgi:hypothetical protein
MLNRTNLTLSALALSSGLNLGTRSLAANASVNNGGETLRIRTSHHDVMRDGMVWYFVFSMPKPRHVIPVIPISLSPLQDCQRRPVTSQQRGFAVDVRVDFEPRPADLVERPEPCAEDRDRKFRTIVPALRDASKRAFDSQSRLSLGSSRKHGVKPTAGRATKVSTTAIPAASGKWVPIARFRLFRSERSLHQADLVWSPSGSQNICSRTRGRSATDDDGFAQSVVRTAGLDPVFRSIGLDPATEHAPSQK